MQGVSIIMAAYNEEANVLSSIRSVQSQTHQMWELIVLDDASTDGTTNCLQLAADSDSRIIFLRNNKNIGLAASLNKALRLCQYPLVARLDADDRCLPERLAIQTEFMNRHSDVDVLGAGSIDIDSAGAVLNETIQRETHEEMVRYIYKECPLIHPTVMVRKHVFDELNGYDESLQRCQDYDLWLRGYKRFRFHNLQIPLICYRRRTGVSWRDAKYSATVIMKALFREGKMPFHLWFVMRPLLACFRSYMKSIYG